MTTLTRCPACATAFRITTEQLVSRQGQVRCGKCAAVFNALENLVAPAQEADELQHAEGEFGGEARNFELFGSDRSHDAAAPGAAPEPAAVSILARESRTERSRFPWISLCGACIAAIALAAQAAWQYRDLIAAYFPQAKPALEAICAEAGCRISAPVDAQAISIESSDLQADPANRAVLVLSAIVRNRAPFAQAPPLLELSLTDAGDAPLARRVLRPADYAPDADAAPIAAGGELQLRVHIDAGQLKASGYRLYAFYP